MKRFDLLTSPLDGVRLIEASAGTGKTYAIAGLYLRLIIEKGLPVSRILVVTFTTAATGELRDRIRNRIRDLAACLDGAACGDNDDLTRELARRHAGDERVSARLRDALRDFDEAAIFTIHAFCQRMLVENAFESRSLFDTALMTDQRSLVREIAQDFWRLSMHDQPAYRMRYLEKMTPDYLTSLLLKHSLDPGFAVVPEPGGRTREDIGEELDGLDSSVRGLFTSIADIWRDAGKEISAILEKDPGINRKRYRGDWLAGWMSGLDAFFAAGDPYGVFAKLSKFGTVAIAEAMKDGAAPPRHLFFDEVDRFLAAFGAFSSAMGGYILRFKHDCFGYFKNELARRKQEKNIRGFNDIIADMYDAVASGEGSLVAMVRKRFEAALIDEFQDTDPLQYRIFMTLFAREGGMLYLIGDPKQAIYAFRSADIFAYLRARQKVEDRATLAQNRRSTPELVGAVNSIFSRAGNPFIFEGIEFSPVDAAAAENEVPPLIDTKQQAPFTIWKFEKNSDDKKGETGKGAAEAAAAKATAAEIARLVSGGRSGAIMLGDRGILPRDIAVIVRRNDQARLVLDELKSRGVPGVLYSSESVFLSHEADEMALLLEATAEPGREGLVRAACSTDIAGVGGNLIFRMLEDEREWEAVLDRFRRYHDEWKERGFIAMFSLVQSALSVRPRLLSLDGGERRVTNLLHLAELLHRAEVEEKLGMEGVAKWLSARRMAEGETAEEHQIRLETDENAVTLVTVHRSKGLEYPVVFCPYLWSEHRDENEDLIFHPPPDYHAALDIGGGSDEHRERARLERLAESVRLMYVALTRAKQRCYMAWGKINQTGSSAPAFLFHFAGRVVAGPDAVSQTSVCAERCDDLSYEELIGELRELASGAGGAIAVEALPDDDSHRFEPEETRPEALASREFRRTVPSSWGIASYSSLSASAHRAREHRDIDIAPEPPGPARVLSDTKDIFSFPKGAKAGSCIHAVFERYDFTAPAEGENVTVIDEALVRYGLDGEWSHAIAEMVRAVIATPLSGKIPGLTLDRIGKEGRLNEMEFYFPLKEITSASFASVMTDASIADDAAGFAAAVESLDFKTVKGYLRGFIDMVFVYEGRYYIVDWKSNYLGGAVDDYSREAVSAAMAENNYILQYHLYALALHNYLSVRLPGYDYDTHFGGVFYLFVRGVSPSGGSDTGIFHDLPAKRLIEAMRIRLVEAGGMR